MPPSRPSEKGEKHHQLERPGDILDPADPTLDNNTPTHDTKDATQGDESHQQIKQGIVRSVAGRAITSLADFVNDNIIAARYGTAASIALLTAYGIAKTPLFFRFRSVSEIPASYFAERKTIHGRVVGILRREGLNKGGESELEEPIVCLVHHLSPAGRLLNRAAFDFSVKHSPKATIGQQLRDHRDLLKVEVAGVTAPPYYHAAQHLEKGGEWLRSLEKNRVSVSCQLLARKVCRVTTDTVNKGSTLSRSGSADNFTESTDPEQQQVAVCRAKYRPDRSFFRKDIGMSLVTFGRASVASGMSVDDPLMHSVDGSSKLDDLRKDTLYMAQLGKAEFDAVKKFRGMWADQRLRDTRKDLVEEAEFETSAGVLKRLWRWLKTDGPFFT